MNDTEDEGKIVANNSVQNLSDSSLISSYFDTSAYTSVYNEDTLSYKITLNKSIAKGSQYETYYRPASKNVCYLIKNIKGYMNSDKKESGEYVEFFVTVAMDGSFVEVASTN